IKSYIIVILFITIFFTIMFTLFQKIRFIVLRVFLTIVMLIIFFFSLSVSNFSEQINDLAEESAMQIEVYQKNYQTLQQLDESSKAGFEIADINTSLSGMLVKSPLIILSCLFR